MVLKLSQILTCFIFKEFKYWIVYRTCDGFEQFKIVKFVYCHDFIIEQTTYRITLSSIAKSF